jgi:hypothetical protein
MQMIIHVEQKQLRLLAIAAERAIPFLQPHSGNRLVSLTPTAR